MRLSVSSRLVTSAWTMMALPPDFSMKARVSSAPWATADVVDDHGGAFGGEADGDGLADA